MGQGLNDAAEKDAQINRRKEECASGMEHHGQRSNVAVKDVQILLKKEECA